MTQAGTAVRAHLGRIYRDVFAPLHYYISAAEFRRLLPEKPSANAIWSVTRTYRGQGWFRDLSAWQVENEYCRMVDWVAAQKPKVILEIGTAKGATLLAWSRIATQLVVSVDLPGGIHGGGYPLAKQRLYERFVADRPGVEMLMFCGDSHTVDLRNRVKNALGCRTIDFLFVDGDHTYEGVTKDFELWTPLVTRGGYVGLHDILPHRQLRDCEVDRFWAGLKRRYPQHFEIVERPDQGWAGIGILQLP